MSSSLSVRTRLAGAAALAALALAACGKGGAPAVGAADAAQRVYVAPGTYDEFYMFASGGFSGQVSVYGLPSGRLLKVIPVFSQNPENAYGYSEETKPMLNTSYGFVPWDDAHHPNLSRKDGVADGRWLFINGNNTPRVARISLTDFTTAEILEIPHSAGNHASPFVTENTEYAVAATRFSVPTPQADVAINSYKDTFGALLTFVKVDSTSGGMSIAFQILMPPFNYDLARAGKGPSREWAFFTTYNTEEANTLLEVNASQNDKDYIAAVHWTVAEQCVAQGKAKKVPARYAHNVTDPVTHVATSTLETSTTFLDVRDCPGVVYFLPSPKSPHGVDVDPSGELIAASGKLASLIPVFGFSRIQQAIQDQAFDGEVNGIPVLKYDAILAGEVKEPGLGPLHTEFDGQGNAYTSMFLSSEIVKWSLKDFTVLDRVPAYYAIGHLLVPGGDTKKPFGKYAISLNKITKDRYLPTGPELTQSAQLYDISGPKMQLLLDFPTIGEPHYAQAIPAALVTANQVRTYDLAHNKDPYAALSESATGVTRQGRVVHVKMTSIRSHFMPDNIEGVQVGDSVYFHVTNLEQDWDVPHGFAVTGINSSELLIMPGETRTIVWVPTKPGVFAFYCTDFCSALHQEMEGRVRVSPRGSSTPISFNSPAAK